MSRAIRFNLSRPTRASHPARGMSLIFSLIALSVLLLCAAALVRSVDTGVLVLGNLGFKRDATVSSDQTTDKAIAWLGTYASLDSDAASSGYYATSKSTLDPTGSNKTNNARVVVDWDKKSDGCASYGAGTFAGCLTPGPEITVNGNKSAYVITRLCSTAAPPGPTNDCASTTISSSGSGSGSGQSEGTSPAKNAIDYGHQRLDVPLPPGPGGAIYYRIVVRTKGAKDTVSFTETVVSY